MNNQNPEKDQLKSLKSQGNRPYGCPCGKFYLSYPALFTHVKQKHGGKAPGELIKPQSGKIRGRPKTKLPADQNYENNIPKIIEAINQLLDEIQIDYTQKFAKSSGKVTCQDIASIFLSQFEDIPQEKYQIIQCFLNLVKYHATQKKGYKYWQQQKPQELIQIANLVYLEHERVQDQFPIDDEILKEFLFNFFQWLYAKKLTDHRLQKREEPDLF